MQFYFSFKPIFFEFYFILIGQLKAENNYEL